MIDDASIDLIVESLNKTEQAIPKLITDHGGFPAESEQRSETSERRHGTWRMRVPADRFESFAGAVSRLGEVRRNHVGTQDLTDVYVDLEARIRNKQEQENRLVKHLSVSTGNLTFPRSPELEMRARRKDRTEEDSTLFPGLGREKVAAAGPWN